MTAWAMRVRVADMAETTIFSKIIAGDIPCHKVYEDDHVLAFLDVNPLSTGHTLVVPKKQIATLDQMPDEDSAAIGRVLPRIARAVLQATGARAFNVLQNNGAAAHQAVFHVHYHIIPRHSDGSGLGVVWRTRQIDHDEGKSLAAKIAAQIPE